MSYQKIVKILDKATPKTKDFVFTDAQIESLKSAAGVALAVVASVGALGIAIVAPNLFLALNKIFLKKYGKITQAEKKKKTAQVFYYLKKQGLIQFKEDKGILKVILSGAGKRKVEALNLSSLKVSKPKYWDGKWWLVAADIPTKQYRQGADMLRSKLKHMGFYPLQRTLWLFPYNPQKELEFVCQQYGVGQFVTLMEVSRLDVQDEQKLKTFFGL